MGGNPHKQHRQRVKERFLSEGLDSFAEHNIIELLLFYGLPRRDTNELAHELIKQFGSFAGVFEASYEELLSVDGLGPNTASLLKVIPAVSRQYLLSRARGRACSSSLDQLIPYLLALFHGLSREESFLLCFDERGRMLASERLAYGSTSAVTINIRRICEIAISSDARTAILAHNHTSGLTVPSGEDWETTRTVRDALRMLDVSLIDHIIVSGESYTSMASMPTFISL